MDCNCLGVTKEQLIYDFGVIFVTGAVYEDFNGIYWESAYTGKYWMADCYDLDNNFNRLDDCPIPVMKKDFKRFVGFSDELMSNTA